MTAPACPTRERAHLLAAYTTRELGPLLEQGAVALLPVGSVEPHGPHLPLATDTIISEAACVAAVRLLAAATPSVVALLAPAVPYGVTDYAAGFAGAVSIPASALTAYVGAVVDALLAAGFVHVCVVNNHLEPAHDAALRSVQTPARGSRVSVACPLTRRWARTLSQEFRSGACHAGQYETSIVLAAAPALVHDVERAALPAVPVSLSQEIAAGKTSFVAMGLAQAYAGAPAQASVQEGEVLITRLAEMICGEVTEALAEALASALASATPPAPPGG